MGNITYIKPSFHNVRFLFLIGNNIYYNIMLNNNNNNNNNK